MKKALAVAAALIMTITSFGYSTKISYAADASSAGTEADKTSGSGTGDDTAEEIETDSDDPTMNYNGRVSFWEWEKVTTANAKQLLGDSKYHASMLIPCVIDYSVIDPGYPCSSANDAYNFWILYRAGKGITSGVYNLYSKVTSNVSKSQTEENAKKYFKPYTSAYNNMHFMSTYADAEHLAVADQGNVDYSVTLPRIQGNVNDAYGYGYLNRDSLTGEYTKHSPAYYFDEYYTAFIKNEPIGKGGKGGVSANYFGDTRFFTSGDSMGVPWLKLDRAKTDRDYGDSKISVEFALQNASMKDSNADTFVPKDGDFWMYVAEFSRSKSSGEPSIYFGNKEKGYVSDHDHVQMILASGTDIWFIAAYNDDFDDDKCMYPTSGVYYENEDQTMAALTYLPMYNYEWLFNCTHREYGISGFAWYVGTPHVFSCFDGETEDDNGEKYDRPKTVIKNGSFTPVKETTYIKEDETEGVTEGIIVPKGSDLVIEKGGVLSVEGNLINNGRIINKGGTIIIKDGGCISPWYDTDEGTIECIGGEIIVMNGGKLFGFVNDGINDINYDRTVSYAPGLKLTSGASLINYGNTVVTYATATADCTIENRSGGRLFVGYNKKDITEFMYRTNVSNTSAENTVEVSGKCTGLKIQGTGSPTFIKEKGSYVIGENAIDQGYSITTPDY